MAHQGSIPTEHIRETHEKFMYPIVRVVSVGRGQMVGGSGIVVYSRPTTPKSSEFETYVLTNHHVVANLIDVSKKWHASIGRDIKVETRSEATVEFFGYENMSRITDAMAKRANVVAWDDQKDLGLLRLQSSQAVAHVAPIMKPDDAKKKLFISTPVYAVGCGLGVPPLLTSGHIGGFDFMMDNYPYTLTTAPTIFGNSGGAVFNQETGEVIGISARIAVVLTGFLGTAPITHMSWSVAPQTIYQFLEEQVFDFIIDPKRTSKECEVERERLRKKALEGLLAEAPDELEKEAVYGANMAPEESD